MTVKKYLERFTSFKGKKIIITGATAGIGLSLAKILVSKDANVVILARNLKKANGERGTVINK